MVEILPVTYRPATGQGRRTKCVHASASRHAARACKSLAPFIVALLAPIVANAATVWTIGPNAHGEAITFTDEQGPCVGSARVAVWQKPGATPVPACYRIEGPAVLLAFFDGDSATIPAAALVKARSL